MGHVFRSKLARSLIRYVNAPSSFTKSVAKKGQTIWRGILFPLACQFFSSFCPLDYVLIPCSLWLSSCQCSSLRVCHCSLFKLYNSSITDLRRDQPVTSSLFDVLSLLVLCLICMSTASARQDRQWWSLSSKNLTPSTSCKLGRESSYSFPSTDRQQPRSNSRKHSSGMKFSTLTTAMGFKSRKPSSLVIQERPDIVVPNPPKVDTVRQRNRPPANSISTVQSSDEPIEPRTPLDDVRDSTPTRRRSLLQTPEPDPFSSQGIRGPANIHDPSRLSVYSGSSASDVISKRSDLGISFKRSSYASSSSHSQYLGTDLSPSSSATSLAAGLEGQKGSPTYVPWL